MPTVVRILAGEIFDAEPVGGADAHALHDAVGQDRERLAVLDREQQHQADIAAVRRGRHLFAARCCCPSSGQVTMSELMRTAPTPNFGTTPSMDFETIELHQDASSAGEAKSDRVRRDPPPFRQFDVSLFHAVDVSSGMVVSGFSDVIVGYKMRVMRAPSLCEAQPNIAELRSPGWRVHWRGFRASHAAAES